jgi:hypothetical protein
VRHLITLLLFCFAAPVLAQCKSFPTEPFQEFIAKFSESKPFAATRTIYPTYTLRHEFGEVNGKETTCTVKTPVSKTKDEAIPTINQVLARNQMAMEFKELKKRKATVAVFKPDTDWLLTYHFVERQGCWYLHHVEDHSL